MAASAPPQTGSHESGHSGGARAFALPKVLTYPSSAPPELITQGAEGRLYKTTFLVPALPCALKYRPPKPYRHAVLDARLTRARILAEARILARCRRDGVAVPGLYAVDEAGGWLMMEWIEGVPVRKGIDAWLAARRRKPGHESKIVEEEAEAEEGSSGQAPAEGHQLDEETAAGLVSLMGRIGAAVGGLHAVSVVHGDLTTSNMMLRPRREADGAAANGHALQGETAAMLDSDIVLIDFGLASQSTSDEDRAVDLYVLEKAFGSTHPEAQDLFPEVLQAYKKAFKNAAPVLKRLEDVRLRGRKRSMVG